MTTGDLIRDVAKATTSKATTAQAVATAQSTLAAAQQADATAATAVAAARSAVVADLKANGPAVDVSTVPPTVYALTADGSDYTATPIRLTDPPAPATHPAPAS